jgi:aldehyde dehydrogenase (NAD+)
VRSLRRVFETGRTRGLEWRRAQLAGIARLLTERESAIFAALRADLGKPVVEAYIGEIAATSRDLAVVRKNLARWMRPERVPTPLTVRPGKARVLKEPLGVVLIIAPWNYPLQLSVGPLIGAIAAGNCAIVKPSEVSPATSALLARLLPEYVDSTAVKVIEGGVPLTTALLEEPFDHVFFTGSAGVGRLVMGAAARHLTSVTLELGGKSPCIVDQHVELGVAAKRIAWGKFFNAGQTCIAPDYVLVHEAVEEALLGRLKDTIRGFYGDEPRLSPDYGRIVNARHVTRLAARRSTTFACKPRLPTCRSGASGPAEWARTTGA